MTDKIIVGIAGKKYHGKDTAAGGLTGFENVKFAGALKGMISFYLEYIGVDAKTRHRMVEGDLKETATELLCGRTPRHAMQTIGTEWGRDLIGDTIWTDAFEKRCALFDKVVCTDMRFPNEVEYIESLGGITVRINRPDEQASAGNEHPSETAISGLLVQYEIQNIGTASELQSTLASLVEYELHCRSHPGSAKILTASLPIAFLAGEPSP